MQILRTVHGSHLYGNNHSESDHDFFEVHLHGKANQKVTGDLDITKMPLDKFLSSVDKGVPQALEALYSPVAVLQSPYAPLLQSLRPSRYKALETYRRTIYNFYLAGDIKRRFHALRLCHNLHELWEFGKFNPRLSTETIFELKELSQSDEHTKEYLQKSTYRIM